MASKQKMKKREIRERESEDASARLKESFRSPFTQKTAFIKIQKCRSKAPSTVQLVIRANNKIIFLLGLPHFLEPKVLLYQGVQLRRQIMFPLHLDGHVLGRRGNNANIHQYLMLTHIQLPLVLAIEKIDLAGCIGGKVQRYFCGYALYFTLSIEQSARRQEERAVSCRLSLVWTEGRWMDTYSGLRSVEREERLMFLRLRAVLLLILLSRLLYYSLPSLPHLMHKSISEVDSSFLTHRPKTDRVHTQASEFFHHSPVKTQRQNPQSLTYMKIAISKTQISLNRGYLQMKRRQKDKQAEQEKVSKTFENNKFIVFRNLHEFEVNIQAQKGVIRQHSQCEKFYGIATFKGTAKTINTHQISIHMGDLTVLSLFQGYDGNLASLTLKKKFVQNLLEHFRKRKSSNRQSSFPIIEESIKQSIEKAQKELQQLQAVTQDNSGSSLVSVIAHEGIIFAVNCGESSVYCSTLGGKLMKMAVPHTTSNQAEVDRIVMAGGKLYQTTVNVPFKKAMTVKGPLRILPSGLTLTRTIGKSLEKPQSKSKKGKEIVGISNIPEVQYIPESEVDWMVIVSSKVDSSVKKERIRDIIDQELAKRGNGYEDSEASQHVCKRVLLQAVQGGSGESVSALLIIFHHPQPQNLPTAPPAQTPSLSRQPRSLKYIGNRKNFVEQLP